MDLSALSEEQRHQVEDIQRRFQEHQQQQNLLHLHQTQQEQHNQFQSYYHSNPAHDQPYQQPYGDYYQYQHHYYHYQHQQQPALPSLPQNNAGSSYSQYVYYQEATPINLPTPAVALESTAHVAYSSNDRPPHSEVNSAPADAVESTAHIGYNSIVRPSYLKLNPVPAVAMEPPGQIGYSSIERPARLELNPGQSMAHIGYSSVQRPAHLELNPVPSVEMESMSHTGYSSLERPARLGLNPAPSVAVESTVRIGYIAAERPAQVELNPAVAAALAEINKLSETIDIAQRTAAIDTARRTAVRLHGGGGSSLEHVIGHGLYNGSLHSPVGLHSYSTNHPPVGGGRGRKKNKSVKNGASGGRHRLALGVSGSLSYENRQGGVCPKDPHKKPSSSANPNNAVEATSVDGKKVWRCGLCKADCNSKEILEQHKGGKKHKKNLERLAEEGRITYNGPVCITSDEHNPLPSGSKEVVMGEELKSEQQTVIQYMPPVKLDPWQDPPAAESQPEAAATNSGVITAPVVEQQQPVVNPGETQRTMMEKKKSKKKKKKIGPVGGVKKPRTRTALPQERKIVIPLACHVCNIKCDTQEVLNKHFAGKKHIGNLKRYNQGYGHQPPVYGAGIGLQALYPSNPMSQSSIYHPSQEVGFVQQETQQALL